MKSAIVSRILRVILFALLAATIAAPAAAQNQGAQETGSTSGSSLGSTTVGDLTIVPVGKTLHIIDERQGVETGKMKFKKKITSVKGLSTAASDLVYVTTSEGLFIVDVGNMAKPIIIGFFPIPYGTIIFSSTLITDSIGNIVDNWRL